jgi:hypothetical protein
MQDLPLPSDPGESEHRDWVVDTIVDHPKLWGILGGWPTLSLPFYSEGCPVQAPLGRVFSSPTMLYISDNQLTSELSTLRL